MDLLKSNFQHKPLTAEPPKPDKQAEYEKRALESICGSMVFVERKRLVHDE